MIAMLTFLLLNLFFLLCPSFRNNNIGIRNYKATDNLFLKLRNKESSRLAKLIQKRNLRAINKYQLLRLCLTACVTCFAAAEEMKSEK